MRTSIIFPIVLRVFIGGILFGAPEVRAVAPAVMGRRDALEFK
jgi:hypothetical protein